MTTYAVRKIDLTKIRNFDEYNKAYKDAKIKYCKGLKEVESYCGGKLHRHISGYSGIKGNIEYVVVRA